MQGYVIELTDVCEYEEDKIKEILAVVKDGVRIESQMIALAGWMRENYGGTMNHALKTVLPVKEKKKAKEREKRIKQRKNEQKDQFDFDTETVIGMTNKNNQKIKQKNQEKITKKQAKILKKKKKIPLQNISTFRQ
jgi:primosomal protein N'